jgi:hypothetical protein
MSLRTANPRTHEVVPNEMAPKVSAAPQAAPIVRSEGSEPAGDGARSDAAHLRMRLPYVSVAAKFALAIAFMVAWVWLSVWISGGWVQDLAPVTGVVVAWVVVILVAYLPGAIVAFMAASLLLDR